jgi:hypothetical protein
MKRALFVLLPVVFVTWLGLTAGFVGCKGDTGPVGPAGPAGSGYADLWEDFEAGNFSTYPWEFTGDADWEIALDRMQFGTKSACSGNINDSEESSISIDLNLPRAGLVSFYSSISCEMGFDWLWWEVDGEIVDGLSGTMDSETWLPTTFAVSPGQHTVRWRFEKDGSLSGGNDCGWIDAILITNYSAGKVTLPVAPEGTMLWSQRREQEK